MSFIGDAILTVSIQLFKRLASTGLLQFARREKIHADLKNWEKTLLKIHAVLADAEKNQKTNRLMKIWLKDLQNSVYDMEDLLDAFATEALQRKMLYRPELDQPKTSKI